MEAELGSDKNGQEEKEGRKGNDLEPILPFSSRFISSGFFFLLLNSIDPLTLQCSSKAKTLVVSNLSVKLHILAKTEPGSQIVLLNDNLFTNVRNSPVHRSIASLSLAIWQYSIWQYRITETHWHSGCPFP